jgi:hypothetical protein
MRDDRGDCRLVDGRRRFSQIVPGRKAATMVGMARKNENSVAARLDRGPAPDARRRWWRRSARRRARRPGTGRARCPGSASTTGPWRRPRFGSGANRSSARSGTTPPTISVVQITVTARLPSTSNSTVGDEVVQAQTPAKTEGMTASGDADAANQTCLADRWAGGPARFHRRCEVEGHHGEDRAELDHARLKVSQKRGSGQAEQFLASAAGGRLRTRG